MKICRQFTHLQAMQDKGDFLFFLGETTTLSDS